MQVSTIQLDKAQEEPLKRRARAVFLHFDRANKTGRAQMWPG